MIAVEQLVVQPVLLLLLPSALMMMKLPRWFLMAVPCFSRLVLLVILIHVLCSLQLLLVLQYQTLLSSDLHKIDL